MKTFAITSALLFASAVGQAAPRTWHFTCDYYNLDVKGHLSGRQRYSASYTRGLPGDVVRWSDVTIANSSGWSGDFGPAQKQDFMEGFSYPHADAANMTKPDFFRGFPPMAMQQRNLVWDTHMVEGFAAELDKLKPNIPFHVPGADEVDLAGAGTFRNRDLQLTLTGNSKRNGQDCAVMDYRALFNTLDVKTGTVALVGRSDYWGQIWVSLATKQIEYATLYEEVLGELTMPGMEKPMTISVVRVGVLEPAGQ
ncbi:MAG: hypothetical protein ABSH47_25055 [Bryobacteraceae bacterium]|jgi:hypothetical protein